MAPANGAARSRVACPLTTRPTTAGTYTLNFRQVHVGRAVRVREHCSMLVAAFGHLVLDVIVRLDERLVDGDDTGAEISIGAGGQAANFTAWATALGASARLVGAVGEDSPGRLVTEQLRRHGVEIVGPTIKRSPVVVSLVKPDATRTLMSDRTAAASFPPAAIDSRWLDGCKWLHISGYALVDEPIATTAITLTRNSSREPPVLRWNRASATVSAWRIGRYCFTR